jgi:hypothetical protein
LNAEIEEENYFKLNYFKMKKIIIAAFISAISITTIFYSCKKEIPRSTMHNSSPNLALITNQIEELGKQHLIKPDNTSYRQKGAVIGLADAVGGVLSAASVSWTGFGAIFAPYCTVWGAFWFSMGVANLRVVNTFSPFNPTVPNVLEYSYLGILHNNAVFQSYNNHYFPIANNNELNNNINSTILQSSYLSFPKISSKSIDSLYNINKNLFNSMLSHASEVDANEGIALVHLIEQSSLSNDMKQICNSIINTVLSNPNCTLDGTTTFYRDVETVLNTSNLSYEDKARLKMFISIAHSSSYYWHFNN